MKIRIKNPIWGVPITFLDKYCPTQFEIIDINPHFFSMVEQGLPKPKQLTLHNVGKKDPYARILIRKIRNQIHFGTEIVNIFSEVKLKNNSIMKIRIKNPIWGVPITFLDKYNPSQFEIIALGNSRENFTPNKDYIKPIKVLKDGKKVNGNAINCVLAIESKTKPINMIYYTSENVPYLIAPYARILIRKIRNQIYFGTEIDNIFSEVKLKKYEYYENQN